MTPYFATAVIVLHAISIYYLVKFNNRMRMLQDFRIDED